MGCHLFRSDSGCRNNRILNIPFITAGIIIKTVYFTKKGLVKAYLKGIRAGLSGKMPGMEKMSDVNDKNNSSHPGIAEYLKLQMWLFLGMVKRIN